MNTINLQQLYSAFMPSASIHKAAVSPAVPQQAIVKSASLSAPALVSAPVDPSRVSPFAFLSYDAILAVLSVLSVQDLGRLAMVSREARQYAEDDVIWRALVKGMSPQWCAVLNRQPNAIPKPCARPGEWKRVYRADTDRLALCSRFVGLWSEKWCDVNVGQSTLIESDGRTFTVYYKKNKFAASFREYDANTDVLTFHLEGGDSGWSFIYRLKPCAENQCQLTVFRIHDQKTFTGDFFRTSPTRPVVDNAMGTHV